MRKLSISTGCFYRKSGIKYETAKKMKNVLKICSKLDIDGIELLFGDAKELLKFKLTTDLIGIFNKFKFNTIHLPFGLGKKPLFIDNSTITRKVLKKIYEIYNKINAKSINLHPQQIKNLKVLDKDYNYTIENMELKHRFKIKDYNSIMKKSKFKIVIDTTHAAEAGELKEIIKEFGKDAAYFHLSGNYFNHLHLPLHSLSKEYLRDFEIIKKTIAPIVLECQIGSSDIKEYKKEVEFVRNWLKN